MTAPLPTLAEIDGELARTLETRTAACEEIASLLVDIAELDVLFEQMLEHRTRIAALPACG